MNDEEQKAFNKERRKLRRTVVRKAMAWAEEGIDVGEASAELAEAVKALKDHEAKEG